AVRGPAHDDVVRPHPVGHLVAAEGGGVGQAGGLAAVGGDDEHLGVPVVLGGERDLGPVRGEPGEHLVAGVRGDAAGGAAGGRNGVQVAGVAEDDFVAVGGGEPQQAGLVRGGEGRRGGGRDDGEQGNAVHDGPGWWEGDEPADGI